MKSGSGGALSVAFECHDFLTNLGQWYESFLQKKGSFESNVKMNLVESWNDLANRLQCLLQDPADVDKVAQFTKAVQDQLSLDLVTDASVLRAKIESQFQSLLDAAVYNEDDFDPAPCQCLQRLGNALSSRANQTELGVTLCKIGEGGQHFLRLTAASVLFVQHRSKLQISSRPDKATRATLNAVAVAKNTALGFFRKLQSFGDFVGLLFQEDSEIQERMSKHLTDMITYADGLWEQQLTNVMETALQTAAKDVEASLGSLPEFSQETAALQAFNAALNGKKIPETVSVLKKKCEACKSCCSLAKISPDFTASFEKLALKGLGLVACASIAMILQSKLWANMTPEKVQDSTKEESKLLASLRASKEFVKVQDWG